MNNNGWRNPRRKKEAKHYAADSKASKAEDITMRPVGVVHSPYQERFATPRQPAYAAESKPACIELYKGRGFEQALRDVHTFSHIWVIYWMHLNQGWNPLVSPPRDKSRKYGVFATRAPHRPNSLGLSVVPLLGVEGCMLHIGAHDMLDGTPVLDIKPYIKEADMLPHANNGWIDGLPSQ